MLSNARVQGMTNKDAKKAKIVFANGPDFKRFLATGIWGGPTSNGTHLAANFFIDTLKNPDYVSMEAVPQIGEQPVEVPKETSRHGETDEETGQPIHIRELQTAVLLTPSDAFLIGAWLMQRAVDMGYKPETAKGTIQ